MSRSRVTHLQIDDAHHDLSQAEIEYDLRAAAYMRAYDDLSDGDELSDRDFDVNCHMLKLARSRYIEARKWLTEAQESLRLLEGVLNGDGPDEKD